MIRKTMLFALAVAAGAATFATPAQANPICVNDPRVEAVYEGCTYIGPGACIQGGGTIAGRIRYMWAPC